ncbi:hypothetical protein MDA_GLEAN10018256 [Myotis davidii]|uniref:Uncharacterized protein n=1 Tax=Myotis davidii TaxID=225400 RepID=L5M3V9_MYODS|nr:hypothetical protein MDA_GLEAN10018256 [Myotis davidii]
MCKSVCSHGGPLGTFWGLISDHCFCIHRAEHNGSSANHDGSSANHIRLH